MLKEGYSCPPSAMIGECFLKASEFYINSCKWWGFIPNTAEKSNPPCSHTMAEVKVKHCGFLLKFSVILNEPLFLGGFRDESKLSETLFQIRFFIFVFLCVWGATLTCLSRRKNDLKWDESCRPSGCVTLFWQPCWRSLVQWTARCVFIKPNSFVCTNCICIQV